MLSQVRIMEAEPIEVREEAQAEYGQAIQHASWLVPPASHRHASYVPVVVVVAA